MIGMANPEVHDLSFGWVPLAAGLLLLVLVLALKFTHPSDSTGDKS